MGTTTGPLRVRVDGGAVAGTVVATPAGPARQWLGIPYACAPQERRFRPPMAAEPWRGTLRADAPGPRAPQVDVPDDLDPARHGQSERDCLTVNVWAPARGDGYPVLVWLHGGGFTRGSNADPATSGERLAARQGVVVVAVAYRLGLLGQLRLEHLLGDEFAGAGCAAMLDQRAALEWVRRNVAGFGGDPGRVTLGGESAGASYTSLHLGTADGLFRGAIVQSGSPERTLTADEGAALTDELLDTLGVPASRAADLVDFPVEWLLSAQEEIARRRRSVEPCDLVVPFLPVLGSPLVPADPYASARERAPAVSLLTGTALNESSAFLDPVYDDRDANRAGFLYDAIATDLFGDAARHARALAAAGLDTPQGAVDPVIDRLEGLLTDVYYRRGLQRLLDARGAGSRTYAYLFAWPSDLRPARRACHAIDPMFVFDHLDESRGVLGPAAPRDLGGRMSALWGAFVRDGSPGDGWPAYAAERRTLVLDAQPRVVADPRRPLRELWSRVGDARVRPRVPAAATR